MILKLKYFKTYVFHWCYAIELSSLLYEVKLLGSIKNEKTSLNVKLNRELHMDNRTGS